MKRPAERDACFFLKKIPYVPYHVPYQALHSTGGAKAGTKQGEMSKASAFGALAAWS